MPVEDYTEYNRDYYHEQRRAPMIEYMGGKCVHCGTTQRLEFDHVNREEKSFNINTNMTLNNPEVRAELAKCQLLCHDCHVEKTGQEALDIGFTHGTMYGWMKRKCQCAACSAAQRAWYDERNEKRRIGDGRGAYGRAAGHGERITYNRGCRCVECKAANAKAERE